MAQNIVEIGDVHVRIPVDNSGGDGPGHTEGGGMAEAADGGGRVCVQVPIDDGGGAATVQTEEGSDVAKNVADTGDVHVQTHIDEGGGAVQVTERGDVTKDNENCGGEHVQVPAVEAPEGADMAKHDEGDSMFKTDTSGDII